MPVCSSDGSRGEPPCAAAIATAGASSNRKGKPNHFPPGAGKWNKIEHRLFSFISQNWRGKPRISHEVIINLIAATTTTTGLAEAWL